MSSTAVKLTNSEVILKPPPDIIIPSTVSHTGRPRRYKTPDVMLPLIEQYFRRCDENNEPYLISGIAIELDMTIEQVCEYENFPEFAQPIKKAKQMCLDNISQGAMKNKFNNAMSIFYLKNCFGWTDKQEITEKKDPEVIQMMKDFIERKSK